MASVYWYKCANCGEIHQSQTQVLSCLRCRGELFTVSAGPSSQSPFATPSLPPSLLPQSRELRSPSTGHGSHYGSYRPRGYDSYVPRYDDRPSLPPIVEDFDETRARANLARGAQKRRYEDEGEDRRCEDDADSAGSQPDEVPNEKSGSEKQFAPSSDDNYYCLMHHCMHKKTVNCQISMSVFAKQERSFAWKEVLGNDWAQTLGSSTYPPQDRHDLMTALQVTWESLKTYPNWAVKRDMYQFQVYEAMVKTAKDKEELSNFYLEITRMANYITRTMVEHIEKEAKLLRSQAFLRHYNAKWREDQANKPLRRDPSTAEKLQDLVRWKRGELSLTSELPEYEPDAYQNFLTGFEKGIQKAISGISDLNFKLTRVFKMTALLSKEDGCLMLEFLVPVILIVGWSNEPGSPPVLKFSDLDEVFSRSALFSTSSGDEKGKLV